VSRFEYFPYLSRLPSKRILLVREKLILLRFAEYFRIFLEVGYSRVTATSRSRCRCCSSARPESKSLLRISLRRYFRSVTEVYLEVHLDR